MMQHGPSNEPLINEGQAQFDAVQVGIAEMGEDKFLRDLMYSHDRESLRDLAGDLNDFASGIKEGKFSKEQIVLELEAIATKSLRTVGRNRNLASTNYSGARKALVRHFYALARKFGVQIELSARLDIWEKENPHTENPKEQTYQEQLEAVSRVVESKFGTMYATVTKDAGYDPEKVVVGCLEYLTSVVAGEQGGPVSYFFGIADKFKLDDAEKKRRIEVMKAKLLPQVKEALKRDAQRATKDVFDPLMREVFPTESSVKERTASSIADELITDHIRLRFKKANGKYQEYKPLAYYWQVEKDHHDRLFELRQNVIYLVQQYWGPALRKDDHGDKQVAKAKVRLGQNPDYFVGYVAPQVTVPKAALNNGSGEVVADVTPPTVREGRGASQPAPAPLPEGEGAIVHDIAAMQAQLAQKAAASSSPTAVSGGPIVVKPAAQPAPAPKEKVIVDLPGVTPAPQDRVTVPEGHLTPAAAPSSQPAAPNSREVKTIPPTARPQRPNVEFRSDRDEVTQMDAHKKAMAEKAKSGGVFGWLKRNAIAIAAVLGIGAVGSVAAYKAVNTYDQKDASSEVAKTPEKTAGASASASVTPAAVASQMPTAAPSVSAEPKVASASPTVTQQPQAPQVAGTDVKAPEAGAKVETVLGTYSYGLGSADGAPVFTGTASVAEGGVDATPFASTPKNATWYAGQQKNAESLLKIYDSNKSLLDKDVVNFISTHETMLRDLAAQTTFTPAQFKKDFEGRYKAGDIFGAKGLYNNLLAFQRIVNLYGGDVEKIVKDKTLIKFSIGAKAMAPELRFAKALQVTAAAVPANSGAGGGVNNGTNGNGNPPANDGTKGDDKGGFNEYTPGNGTPGNIPTDILPGSFPSQDPELRFGFAAPQKVNPGSSANVRTKFLDDWKALEAKKAEVAKTEKDLLRQRESILASYEMDQIDAAWDTIAAEHQKAAERKQALKAELDAKMAKIFAKGKAMEAERAKAPALEVQKTYKVAATDKSIKFVLERQIQASKLNDESKAKAMVALQDMIRSNGAFIESYKLHADGSRDLTLKDEWRTKLHEAAGVQLAAAQPAQEEVLEELTDDDIIEVIDPRVSKAA